ncbi:hypothetical protein [Deinococcus sp. Marseille-Q6407]|uniref:hypothetical protein n=1 Tax=Deinococcus sp. Marseille-Q6407 TaxID=2969223 RepID=UPI0021BF514D|nr:hypothetical protein [Deinococcus sp. Marseille-Q6407]
MSRTEQTGKRLALGGLFGALGGLCLTGALDLAHTGQPLLALGLGLLYPVSLALIWRNAARLRSTQLGRAR